MKWLPRKKSNESKSAETGKGKKTKKNLQNLLHAYTFKIASKNIPKEDD